MIIPRSSKIDRKCNSFTRTQNTEEQTAPAIVSDFRNNDWDWRVNYKLITILISDQKDDYAK